MPLEDITELTDDEGTGAEIAARVSEAILKADTIIDSYCRGKHTLPFSPVPQFIEQLSVELAIYFLYKRRRLNEMDEGVQTSYNEAMKMLRDISKGIIKIDDEDSFQNSAQIYECNKTTDDRTYDDDFQDEFV